MTLRSTISTLAVLSALTFSGAAFAQAATSVTIDGTEYKDKDFTSLQEKCAAINSAATETLAEPVDNDNADATSTGSTEQSNEPGGQSADPANADNLDALLASLTPEKCKAAGLSTGLQTGGQ